MEREKVLDNFRSLCAMTASYHRAKAMGEDASIDKSIGNAVMKDIIGKLYNEGIAPVVEQVLLNTIQIGIDQDDWIDQLTKRFFDQVLFSSTIEEEAVTMTRLDSVKESLSTLTVFSFNEVQRQNMISSAVNMVIGNSSIRAAIFSAILAKYYCNDSGLSMTSLVEVYRSITVFEDTITMLLESTTAKLDDLMAPVVDPVTVPVGPVTDSSERVTGRGIVYTQNGKPIVYESKYLMMGIIQRAPEYLISLCQNLHPSDMFKSDTMPREPSPIVEFIFSEMSRIVTGIEPTDCMGLTLYDVLMEIFRLTPEKILSGEYNFLDYVHDMIFYVVPGFRYKMLDNETDMISFIVHVFPKESITEIVYEILKAHREMTERALDKNKSSMLAKIGIISAFRDIVNAIWGPANNGTANVIMPTLLLREFDHTDIFNINAAEVTSMIWNLMPTVFFQFEEEKTLAMFMKYLAKEAEFNPEPEKEEPTPLAQNIEKTEEEDPIDKAMEKSASEKYREQIDPTMFTRIKTTDEKHPYARVEKKESEPAEESAHAEEEWLTPYVRIIQSSQIMSAGEKIIPSDFFIDITDCEDADITHIGDHQSLRFNIQKFKAIVSRCIEDWFHSAPASKTSINEAFDTIRAKIYPTMYGRPANDFTGTDLMSLLSKSELPSRRKNQEAAMTVDALLLMVPMYDENTRGKEIDESSCFSLTKQELCDLAIKIYRKAITDFKAANPEDGVSEDLIHMIARAAVHICYDKMPGVEYSTGIKDLICHLLVSNGIIYAKTDREMQLCIIRAITQLFPVDSMYS